jgi:hypothetical protein
MHHNYDTFYIDMAESYVRNYILVSFKTNKQGLISELHGDFERSVKDEFVVFEKR